jgi:CBS domain-containing protein
MPAIRPSRVSHPILRLHVLSGGGDRASERVFCRYRRASVPVEECASCVRCDEIQRTSAPSVDCTIPVAPERLIADPSGERTEVGTLLCTGATAIEQSAPLREALRLLHDGDQRSIAVVDEDTRLVGIVHEMAFVQLPRDKGLPMHRREDDDVTVAMSAAIAIHEVTPVRVALRMLASSHLREATVVCSDGKPLGVFRDVDGLRWIARAKKGAAG